MGFYEAFRQSYSEITSLPLRIIMSELGVALTASVVFMVITLALCEKWDKKLFAHYEKDRKLFRAMHICRIVVGFSLHAVLLAFYNALLIVITTSETRTDSEIENMDMACVMLYLITVVVALWVVHKKRVDYQPTSYVGVIDYLGDLLC